MPTNDDKTRPEVIAQLLAVDDTGVCANYIRRLESEIATLRAERDEAVRQRNAVTLECAGKLSFVLSHDVPETERAAKVVLVQRCEQAEAKAARLREGLFELKNTALYHSQFHRASAFTDIVRAIDALFASRGAGGKP